MDLLFAASFAGFCIAGAACAWVLCMPPPRTLRVPLLALLMAVLAGQGSALASTLPTQPLQGKAWALCGCAWWSVSGVLWLWLAARLTPHPHRVAALASGWLPALAAVALVPWALGLLGRAAYVAAGSDLDCTLWRWGGLGSASAGIVAAAVLCARHLRGGGPQPLLLFALAAALLSTLLRALDADQSAAPPLLALAASLGVGAVYPSFAPVRSLGPSRSALPMLGERREDASDSDRHRMLVEHLPVGVLCVDLDLCVVDANPALAEMVGAPDAAMLLGTQIQDSPLYQRVSQLRAACETILGESRAVSFEAEWQSYWGRTVRARVLGRPLRDPQGSVLGVQLVLCDSSSEQRLREQLIQSQRMESVGQLAGRIAHDFNNYLSVILGHAELLQLELPEAHPLAANAAAISGAAQRSAMLTRRLLSLSRPHLYDPRRVDVNRLISDLASMLRSVLGASIAIESELEPAVLVVYADPWQLELALMNLTINARDAMPQGGRFRIVTRAIQLSPRDASAFSAQTGRYVVVAVSDTGHGMDADTRARIFEPFFTTKEQDRGTGLGLSTVWGVAEECRGFVRVESQQGQGSTFELFLPYAEEPAAEIDGSVRAAEVLAR